MDHETEKQPAITVEAETLTSSIGEGTPLVDELNAAQAPVDNTPAADPQDGERPKDKNGEVHNPEIHATPPKLKKDGTWSMKRGRGAKKWQQNDADKKAVGSFVHQPGISQAMAAAPNTPVSNGGMSAEEAKALAAECTAATIALGVLVGGPKFQPGAMKHQNGLNADQERGMIFGQYHTYITESGMTWKPPAWLGLAIGLTTYCAPRFHEPEVKKHAKMRIWGWTSPIGKMWAKFRKPKEERKKQVKKEVAKTGPQKSGPQKKTWAEENGFEGAGGMS